jgi:hypothetical protein
MLVAVLAAWGALGASEAEVRKRLGLDEIEAKLAALSEEVDDIKGDTGFRSLLDESFDLGGEVEIEMVDAQSEWNPNTQKPSRAENSPYMRIDKIRLSPRIRITKKDAPIVITAEGDLDFLSDTGRARVKEYYLDFEAVHADWAASRLRVGQDDRFMRPDHDTEFWPLAATTFWRRETIGVFWRTELWDDEDLTGEWSIHASVTNGNAFDDREPGEGEDDFVIVSHDTRTGFGESELREYAVGLGWQKRWRDPKDGDLLGRIETDLLGFYYNDSMGDDDEAYLADSFPELNPFAGGGAVGTNPVWTGDGAGNAIVRQLRGRELWGGNAVLEVGELTVTAHVVRGRDGGIKRKSGYVEGAYKIAFTDPLLLGDYIDWVMPLVRYGWLDSNIPRIPTNTRTWDRRRWTVALLTRVRRNLILKTEYAFNEEKIGGVNPKDPNTNEFLVQLELTF